MATQEMISGFQGSEAYPKYNEKVIQNIDVNINATRHLLKANKPISAIGWETNLRSYTSSFKINNRSNSKQSTMKDN